MSKKKVLDYDPKTGFGNFAEVMNANNAIDMAQNKVNTGMAPVTAPVANPAAGGAGVANAPMKLETPTPTPVVGDAADVGGDVVATGGGTTVETATEIGATARPITSTPITSGPKQEEADWYAAQGLDPDKDYEEARAALEYDYETSMATYGQRAEELYQMGLSNSGVSDIYQLGAFNAYLASQNDLAYQRIEAKKKNKQAYLAYDKEYQAGVKADTANAYNFGLEQFDWEMGEDGSFTTNNAENIRAQLLAQGYDAGIVDNVINKLTALDPASLPTEKAQEAERKKAQEEANAKEELKTTATRLAFNAYNGENIGEVESMLLNTPGVDSQMAQEILKYLGGLTPEKLADSTAYKKKQAELAEKAEYDERLENVAFNRYTGKNREEVKQSLMADGATTAEAEAAVAAVEAGIKDGTLVLEDSMAYKQMVEEQEKNMVTVTGEDGTSYKIDINKLQNANAIIKDLPESSMKEDINQALTNSGMKLNEQELTAVYESFKNSHKLSNDIVNREIKNDIEADITTLTNLPEDVSDAANGTINISEYYSKLNEVNSLAAQGVIDSAVRDRYKVAVKNAADSAISHIFTSTEALANAYTVLGYDQAQWSALPTEEKYLSAIEAVGKYYQNGWINENVRTDIFAEWFVDQVVNISYDNPVSALVDYESLIETVKGFIETGYLPRDIFDNNAFNAESDFGKKVNEKLSAMGFGNTTGQPDNRTTEDEDDGGSDHWDPYYVPEG